MGLGIASAGFRMSSLEGQCGRLKGVKLGGSEAVACMVVNNLSGECKLVEMILISTN